MEQQLMARIVALETALQGRDAQIQEVANAAAQAAAGMVNAPVVHQAVLDAHGHPVNHRAEKRYDIACKSLGHAPKFFGKESWRTFETGYETWYRVNKIDEQSHEFQKRSILSCMRGNAVEMTRPYNEGTATWRDCPTMTFGCIQKNLSTTRGE